MLRRLLTNTTVVVLSTVFALVLVEFALRVIPNRYAVWHDYYARNASTVEYQRDERAGRIMRPNQRATKEGPCYTITPILTNSIGYRDGEVDPTRPVDIAVLGDSMIEAVQVSEADHVSAILERLLGVEVMNTAVSGFQTIMELMTYRNVIQPYRPRVVVLFLYMGNDIHRNLCDLGGQAKYYCARLVDGDVEYVRKGSATRRADAPTGAKGAGPSFARRVKKFLRRNLVLYLPLWDLKEYATNFFTSAIGHVPEWLELYMPSEPGKWPAAWTATGQALADIKREVEANGGIFLTVVIPAHVTITKTLTREIALETGQTSFDKLDPLHPHRRIREIVERHGVRSIDLLQQFLAYRDRFAMDYPYFFFSCDGHWNPIGHFLAANAVARYLIEKRLLPLAEQHRSAVLARIATMLDRSPRDVLGDTAYDQIFTGKRYFGLSNIPALLDGTARGRQHGSRTEIVPAEPQPSQEF